MSSRAIASGVICAAALYLGLAILPPSSILGGICALAQVQQTKSAEEHERNPCGTPGASAPAEIFRRPLLGARHCQTINDAQGAGCARAQIIMFAMLKHVSETLTPLDLDAYALDAALRKALKLSERWLAMPPVELKSLVQEIVDRITVAADRIEIQLSRAKIAAALQVGERGQRPDLDPVVLSIEAKVRRAGKGSLFGCPISALKSCARSSRAVNPTR